MPGILFLPGMKYAQIFKKPGMLLLPESLTSIGADMPKKLTSYPQKSRGDASEWSLQDAKSPKAQEKILAQLTPEGPKPAGRPKKAKKAHGKK